MRGAAAAFARTGYSATSMEDIAAASGITKLIVYRHFDSKADLYRRVLERVFERMRDVFLSGLGDAMPGRTAVDALLTAAREDADGFRLLWRHSAREPEFAAYAEEVRESAVGAARMLLAPSMSDPTTAEWGAHTVVAFLVEATLAWLDHGEASRDAEFTRLTTRSLRGMIGSWVR